MPQENYAQTMAEHIQDWVDSPIGELRKAVGKTDAQTDTMTKGELVAWLFRHWFDPENFDD